MRSSPRPALLSLALSLFASSAVYAQATGNSGTVRAVVTDPSGAVVPGALVTVANARSGLSRTAVTDTQGQAQVPNLPVDSYTLTVSMNGFATSSRTVALRSVVPVSIPIKLAVVAAGTSVTVEAEGDLVENSSDYHTDLDRRFFNKIPLESQSSPLSSLITLGAPGVAADSNGLMHGLGDHASNTFSIDGQNISDQQSKVFSNQVPLAAVQSMQVIEGAPPAEYGDKTSLVVDVTTRSGLGLTHPTGSVSAEYGTFGTAYGEIDVGNGGDRFGNFFVINGLRTGRFLDAPEFDTLHDKGNEENVWDRIDFKLTDKDSIHMNLNYTRSWYQDPNTYDQLQIGATDPVTGNPLPQSDQRSQVGTFIISPTYTRVIGQNAVFNFNPYVRKDYFYYYPSANPFSDYYANQSETVQQRRTLLNDGARADLSFDKGRNAFKIGAYYQQTPLRESTSFGIVNPTLNSPCIDTNGVPVAGFNDPSQCAAAGYPPNTADNPAATAPFFPALACFDLTRPTPSVNDACTSPVATSYQFIGKTDVKQTALYAEDRITAGNWLLSLGVRGDLYNGLSVNRQAEPRVGISYKVDRSNTVLRLSYARTMETPFNENLVLSSRGCNNAVLNPLLACTPGSQNTTLIPGHRNEFHAGFEQSFGPHLVVGGEYIWKYTHRGLDFSDFGNTPIFFPIQWTSSKIPGFALNVKIPNYRGFTVSWVASSVAARFFNPQTGGAGATVQSGGTAFRIDHDERFNQNTNLQYQFRRGPFYSFNWHYDSGLVAGSAPFATDTTTPVDLTYLTADQQFEAGLSCGTNRASLTNQLQSCAPGQLGSTLLRIPAPGTENDDRNPPRVAPRHLFDMALGDDNLFHGDRKTWSARVTVVNVTNKYALYNFLSTFSGTHYVTPRTVTGQVAFHF